MSLRSTDHVCGTLVQVQNKNQTVHLWSVDTDDTFKKKLKSYSCRFAFIVFCPFILYCSVAVTYIQQVIY